MKQRPKIVCLCGSTRFMDTFHEINGQETYKGHIVLSVGVRKSGKTNVTEEEAKMLDELHKRKIDLADEVIVIDVDGYIGSSTREEIQYAKSIGKPVFFLSELNA